MRTSTKQPRLKIAHTIKQAADELLNLEAVSLKERIKDLERELRAAQVSQAHDADYQKFVGDAARRKVDVPQWLEKKSSRKPQPAIPTSMLSDLHGDEVVDKDEVEGVNEYDRAIAKKRLENFFNKTVRVAKTFLSGITYNGIVIPIGGDIVSGIIHEELRETNGAKILDGCLYWSAQIASGLRYMADEFDNVYAPCVVGNHGRLDKKPRAKGAVQDNFDWLVYELIARELASDKRIRVDVSKSFDISFAIYDTRYRMTHGDQFRGGSGISGLLAPLMIGDARKRKRSVAAGTPYDYLIMGHWHQRDRFKNIIVNGSLKGMDEWAMKMNFDFQIPQQAFWLTDAEHGVTFEAPINVA